MTSHSNFPHRFRHRRFFKADGWSSRSSADALERTPSTNTLIETTPDLNATHPAAPPFLLSKQKLSSHSTVPADSCGSLLPTLNENRASSIINTQVAGAISMTSRDFGPLKEASLPSVLDSNPIRVASAPVSYAHHNPPATQQQCNPTDATLSSSFDLTDLDLYDGAGPTQPDDAMSALISPASSRVASMASTAVSRQCAKRVEILLGRELSWTRGNTHFGIFPTELQLIQDSELQDYFQALLCDTAQHSRAQSTAFLLTPRSVLNSTSTHDRSIRKEPRENTFVTEIPDKSRVSRTQSTYGRVQDWLKDSTPTTEETVCEGDAESLFSTLEEESISIRSHITKHVIDNNTVEDSHSVQKPSIGVDDSEIIWIPVTDIESGDLYPLKRGNADDSSVLDLSSIDGRQGVDLPFMTARRRKPRYMIETKSFLQRRDRKLETILQNDIVPGDVSASERTASTSANKDSLKTPNKGKKVKQNRMVKNQEHLEGFLLRNAQLGPRARQFLLTDAEEQRVVHLLSDDPSDLHASANGFLPDATSCERLHEIEQELALLRKPPRVCTDTDSKHLCDAHSPCTLKTQPPLSEGAEIPSHVVLHAESNASPSEWRSSISITNTKTGRKVERIRKHRENTPQRDYISEFREDSERKKKLSDIHERLAQLHQAEISFFASIVQDSSILNEEDTVDPNDNELDNRCTLVNSKCPESYMLDNVEGDSTYSSEPNRLPVGADWPEGLQRPSRKILEKLLEDAVLEQGIAYHALDPETLE